MKRKDFVNVFKFNEKTTTLKNNKLQNYNRRYVVIKTACTVKFHNRMSRHTPNVEQQGITAGVNTMVVKGKISLVSSIEATREL